MIAFRIPSHEMRGEWVQHIPTRGTLFSLCRHQFCTKSHQRLWAYHALGEEVGARISKRLLEFVDPAMLKQGNYSDVPIGDFPHNTPDIFLREPGFVFGNSFDSSFRSGYRSSSSCCSQANQSPYERSVAHSFFSG